MSVEITARRVLLRELRIEDAESAQRYEQDPLIVRYQSNGIRTLEESREYIRGSMASAGKTPRYVFDLALCLRETGEYIGRIGLGIKSLEHREAMLWYVVDRAHQGRGYVTEAGAALLDFAFDTLALHRVYIDTDPRNLASVRVAEKLGMQYEGRLRENFWKDGEWTDSAIYGILDREWETVRTL